MKKNAVPNDHFQYKTGCLEYSQTACFYETKGYLLTQNRTAVAGFKPW